MNTAALTVVHALPGRVRLRLPAHADAEGLAEVVSSRDGVTACTWSPRTRGLLVRFDPRTTDATAIADHVAAHAGVDAPAAPGDTPPVAPIALTMPALFARANQGLAQATRGTIDLASGIPVLLVAWAALELVRGRTAPLAWSSALWYAHGLFRDYNNLDRPAQT